VANAGDLEEGQPRIVSAGDDAVLLVRIRGIIHATAATCPHKFTSLEDAVVADAGTITCSQHHACFALATGAPLAGSEFAGRLPVFQTQVVDGVVQVLLR
jgi:nitrite reductase/ring-hydroxylating ferredoxin subunit